MAKKKETTGTKPEKLKVLTTSEVPKAENKPKKLGVISSGDLVRPPKIKAAKSYKPSKDTIITTADMKPRKWKNVPKL